MNITRFFQPTEIGAVVATEPVINVGERCYG